MMKSFRNLALAGLMTIGAFSAVTFTSCNSDKCKDVVCQNSGTCNDGNCACTFEYEGGLCENQVRTRVAGSYKGSGTDSDGDTYTNFTFAYSTLGTDAKSMQVVISDQAGDPFLTLPITLTSANTYTINSTTIGGFSFSGNGTFNTNSASIVINQAGTPPLVVTFTSLVKQ